MAALRLAYSPFWKALNSTQQTATPTTVCCRAMRARLIAASRDMPSVQRCRRPRSRPRPKARVVRSDRAPATGVAMTDATAPAAETAARARILWPGVMSCSCWGMLTCSGVRDAIHMPRDASPSPAIQPRRTCTVGSASACESACWASSAVCPVMTPPRHAPGAAARPRLNDLARDHAALPPYLVAVRCRRQDSGLPATNLGVNLNACADDHRRVRRQLPGPGQPGLVLPDRSRRV